MGFSVNEKTNELSIPKGDTDDLEIEISDEDTGIAEDITDCIIYFTVKKDADSEAVISKTVTEHTDAVNGLSKIELLKIDTTHHPDRYLYDLVIVYPEKTVNDVIVPEKRRHIIKSTYFNITPTITGV